MSNYINENLGAQHISSDLQNYESARSNHFKLIISDLDELLYPEFSHTGTNAANEYVTGTAEAYGKKLSAAKVLELSLNKMFVPHFTLGTIEVKRGNSTVKFADTPTWDSGKTIEIQDFIGLEAKTVLLAWQALAYDVNTDEQGRAGDWEQNINGQVVKRKGYKKNCELCEYTADGELIRYWTLIGCFITSINESDFDKSQTGARQITATMEFDRAVMHMPDDKWSKEKE